MKKKNLRIHMTCITGQIRIFPMSHAHIQFEWDMHLLSPFLTCPTARLFVCFFGQYHAKE